MPFIPSEILDVIIRNLEDVIDLHPSFVHPDDHWNSSCLAPYAVVSRQWQVVVERYIWTRLVLTNIDSIEALQAFTSGNSSRRSQYVRYILWCPVIPRGKLDRPSHRIPGKLGIETHDGPGFDSRQDKWFIPLQRLLEILDAWGETHSGIELFLGPYLEMASPCSCDLGNEETLEPEAFTSLTTKELFEKYMIPDPINLTEDMLKRFARPSCIKALRLHNLDQTTFRPEAFFGIVKCLPCVRDINSGEGRFIPPFAPVALRECRQDITECLKTLPDSLETFSYEIYKFRELSCDPDENAADYLFSTGLDSFSIALRNLSMRLCELRLDSVRISSSLFWPCLAEATGTMCDPHWPKLEILYIRNMPPYHADGQWLLDNDPSMLSDSEVDDDSEDRDYSGWGLYARGLIQSRELDAIYQAMGRAARNMPQLRKLNFSFHPGFGTDLSDYLNFDRDVNSKKSTLSINTYYEYHIGEDVLSAWCLQDKRAEEFRQTLSAIHFQG